MWSFKYILIVLYLIWVLLPTSLMSLDGDWYPNKPELSDWTDFCWRTLHYHTIFKCPTLLKLTSETENPRVMFQLFRETDVGNTNLLDIMFVCTETGIISSVHGDAGRIWPEIRSAFWVNHQKRLYLCFKFCYVCF